MIGEYLRIKLLHFKVWSSNHNSYPNVNSCESNSDFIYCRQLTHFYRICGLADGSLGSLSEDCGFKSWPIYYMEIVSKLYQVDWSNSGHLCAWCWVMARKINHFYFMIRLRSCLCDEGLKVSKMLLWLSMSQHYFCKLEILGLTQL